MFTSMLAALLNYPVVTLRISPIAGSFPRPLTPEEEKKYVILNENGDLEARNILIERNLRLVAHIIKKYYTLSDEQDDLISIGTIGLIKGITTYRSDKGVHLATYASRCIENEILMYFRSRKRTVNELSLSDTLDLDGDDGGLSLMDTVSVEEDITDAISTKGICDKLKKAISDVLDEREKTIVTLRYGLDGGKEYTQRETGEKLGISRSYVSRIEKKALNKLRECIEKE